MYKEIKNYQALNRLAKRGCTVILGGSEDKDIPLCELKQAFEMETDLYNRSVCSLSIKDAIQIYDACIAQIKPAVVLLHIGAADLELLAAHPGEFDLHFHKLIEHIKQQDKDCRIAVITLKEQPDAPEIPTLNAHLQAIAQHNRCVLFDLNSKRVWNPKATKDALSFVYALGLARPNVRPLYDIIKILFCYDVAFAE